MAKLIALYNHPKDKAKFDEYYFSKHAPLAKTLPGLKHYDVSDGSVASPGGNSPYHLVATLTFGSLAEIQEGLTSAKGQEVAADLENFADGGVQLMMFDTKDV